MNWKNTLRKQEIDMDISKAPLFGMSSSKISRNKRDEIIEAAMKELDALVETYKGDKQIKLAGFSVTNYFDEVNASADTHAAVLKEKYYAKSVEIDKRNSRITLNF